MDIDTARSILESAGIKYKRINENITRKYLSARIEFDVDLDPRKMSKPNLLRKWEELGIEALEYDDSFNFEKVDDYSFKIKVNQNHVSFNHCYFDLSGWREVSCLLKVETFNLDKIQAEKALISVKRALEPVLDEIRNLKGVVSTSDLRIVL
jgi:hypothetical protein